MATRRRIPMVGDVTVPLEQPPMQVVLRRKEGLSSEQEARGFDWDAYEGLVIAALIIPRSTDGLVDYWKANANILDWAKKVKPDTFERIREAFAARKQQILGAQNG